VRGHAPVRNLGAQRGRDALRQFATWRTGHVGGRLAVTFGMTANL
jgi:hypothetical protein